MLLHMLPDFLPAKSNISDADSLGQSSQHSSSDQLSRATSSDQLSISRNVDVQRLKHLQEQISLKKLFAIAETEEEKPELYSVLEQVIMDVDNVVKQVEEVKFAIGEVPKLVVDIGKMTTMNSFEDMLKFHFDEVRNLLYLKRSILKIGSKSRLM